MHTKAIYFSVHFYFNNKRSNYMNTSETQDVQTLISFINRIKDRLHNITNNEITEYLQEIDGVYYTHIGYKSLAYDLLKEFFNE